MKACIHINGLLSIEVDEGQTDAESDVVERWNLQGKNINMLSKWRTIVAEINDVGYDAKGGVYASLGVVDLETVDF